MSRSDGGPIGRREVAYRLFAAEYDDADLEYSDSEEERAPNYVVTPTGARVNRLFVVGVLTEVEPVSDDVLRARVVDPTGAFVIYAGQYQPDAVAFLEGAAVPSFVAVTGKARTFQPEGSDRVFTSVRPEAITTVDAGTRDRWTVQAAEHTLARVATAAAALDHEERGEALVRALETRGVEPGLASGVALAIDHYGTDRGYLGALREVAIAAVEVVAGEREAVPGLDANPTDAGPVDADLTAAPAVPGTLAGPAVAEPTTRDVEAPSAADDGAPPAVEATAADPDDAATGEPSPTGDEPGPADDELGDFEPEESTELDEPFELDEAEREAVEAEFGTEFSPGSEVGEPGEAGLDTETEPPDTEVTDAATGEGDPAVVGPDAGADSAADESEDQAVDLEDAVVGAMADLDDGDGAPRAVVVESVAETHGVDEDAVEAAVRDALMGGRCYEPEDDRLKAI